jgi:hypothetical protein
MDEGSDSKPEKKEDELNVLKEEEEGGSTQDKQQANEELEKKEKINLEEKYIHSKGEIDDKNVNSHEEDKEKIGVSQEESSIIEESKEINNISSPLKIDKKDEGSPKERENMSSNKRSATPKESESKSFESEGKKYLEITAKKEEENEEVALEKEVDEEEEKKNDSLPEEPLRSQVDERLNSKQSEGRRLSSDHKREEIFHNACLDRKRSAFEALRTWDEQRASLLNLHRNLIENIQSQIDTEVKKSEDFVVVFIKYLKERLNQEAYYAKHQLTKIAVFTKETNSIYQNVVEEFENSHLDHCKKVGRFAQIIENNIIKHLLEGELIAYEKKIEGVRENLVKLKKNITRLNIETSEKSARYSTLYFTMINAPYRKKTNKDLYRRQISFLSTAREQVDIERILGKEIMFYWEVVVKLERNRREMLNKALTLYINSFIDVYGKKKKISYEDYL